MTDPKKRAAIYARVSSADQRENSSLDNQVVRGRDAARARGWQVMGEYREDFTGTVQDRPRWADLMGACDKGLIDVVIVLKWDRIARNALVGLELATRLEQLGVGLVVLDADFDTTTHTGLLMRHMMLGFAEFDRNQLVDRMARGQHAMAERGGWPSGGAAAYGYRVVGGGRDNRLEICAPEAAVIRMVTSWIVNEGLTNGQAAKRLNLEGFTTRKGGPWTHQNLRRILGQRVLLGEFTWGNTEKTHRGYRPTGKYGPPVLIRYEPIIGQSQFEALQVALARTSITHREGNKVYPLSGRLHAPCGDCYGGVSNRGHRQYRCRRRKWTATGRPACGDAFLNAEDVEQRVWVEVCRLLRDPDRLLGLAQDYLGLRRGQIRIETEELSTVQAKVDRLERAQSDILPDLLRRGLDAEAIEAATRVIVADLAETRARLVTLQRWSSESKQESKRVRDAWALAELADDHLAVMSLEERAQILRLLDVHVWVLDESKQPGLRIQGTLCHERLFDGLRTGDPQVAEPPQNAPPRRRCATAASEAPP
jgi:DNA invertase Pin-like site-specific DNA recombinase